MGKRLQDSMMFVWRMIYPLLFYAFVSELIAVVFLTLGREPYGRDAVAATAVSAAVAAVPLAAFYEMPRREIPRPKLWNRRSCLWVAITGVGACFFVNHMIKLCGLTSAAYRAVSSLQHQPSLIVQVIGIGIVTPVTEELIFRGLGYGKMRRELSFGWAALLSAVYFGGYHGNMVQGVYAFCLGLLMAGAYEAYQSLWAPICLHVSANLSSILFSALAPEWAAGTVAMAALMAVSAVMMIFGIYKIREDMKKNETSFRSNTML